MDELWTVLGLESTKDVSAIRRAYAEKAKTCRPEGFMKLRQAYQAALAYAEGREEAASPPTVPEAAEPEDEGWTLTDRPAVIDEGPNPFADHPAARAFLDLCTGKRRKDPQAWMDYFTSGDFLDVGWERRFAGLLLDRLFIATLFGAGVGAIIVVPLTSASSSSAYSGQRLLAMPAKSLAAQQVFGLRRLRPLASSPALHFQLRQLESVL
nr:hypothetical protein [uncultured Oscillibacter sp.]